MENKITLINPRNGYLKQFQIAQINLALVTEEERLTRRIKNIRKKSRTND
ncbi:hypothetical protein [Pseudochryseolinea flava]|nr:hypothetical protein [Pseudochryseolinea flava]